MHLQFIMNVRDLINIKFSIKKLLHLISADNMHVMKIIKKNKRSQ